MIIFGTTGITSVQSKGTYHCPACGPGAAYQHKSVRRFFTLFFVPLIPMGKAGDYILCERCGGNFKPEVLTWGGIVPSSPTGAPPPPPLPGAAPTSHSPAFHGASATTVSYQSNGLAKSSMILGIVGLLSSFLFCPSIFFCIVGLILGIVGLNRWKKGKGLVGGKKQAIAGIACSSLGLVAMLIMGIALAKSDKPEPEARTPRQEATNSISPPSERSGYGNSPQAVALAEKYAALMSEMHQAAFVSNKGKSPKSAKYVVHCELGEGTCAFLAFVPEYRKFEDDAKTSLEELAWSAARKVTKDELSLKPDYELCVALKGMLLFGSVMTGSINGDSPTTNTKDEEDIDRFFPPAAEKETKSETVE